MTQPDMQQILAQAQQMQEQLQQAQQEIMATEVVGEAGNGLVKATMNGAGHITGVEIDPKVVDPEDVDTLQDLVLGALEDAHKRISDVAEEKMGPLQNAGFGGDLDGMLG
ncbi:MULTISPECIES: YbaB/EbfC family nucleoid-associated protein [Corynebacterium]|uniref:YbaB/EbfC family nucleoid-associated protein n=1 Tax=Corynebacterium TaxID=1716 RepID=UPI00124F1003|nr:MULTISPECIES: YbaB/EbfC family nucleoid-associated protein [Corynebacterium]